MVHTFLLLMWRVQSLFVVTIVSSSYTVYCYNCGEFIHCLLLQLWRVHRLFVVAIVESSYTVCCYSCGVNTLVVWTVELIHLLLQLRIVQTLFVVTIVKSSYIFFFTIVESSYTFCCYNFGEFKHFLLLQLCCYSQTLFVKLWSWNTFCCYNCGELIYLLLFQLWRADWYITQVLNAV